jgi:hypothetical protein
VGIDCSKKVAHVGAKRSRAVAALLHGVNMVVFPDDPAVGIVSGGIQGARIDLLRDGG